MRAREKLTQVCLLCGVPVASARYCSNRHHFEHVRKVKGEAWMNGDASVATGGKGELMAWARIFLFEQRGRKCEECGWDKRHPLSGIVPVQFDHTDGNARNNAYTNIKLLCPNCHSLTPTYGGYNHPNGRKKYGAPALGPYEGRWDRRITQ